MNVPIIALFNNRGGVGKTSLACHLASMYADLDIRVIVADFEPQANLTSMFLDEDRPDNRGLHPRAIRSVDRVRRCERDRPER